MDSMDSISGVTLACRFQAAIDLIQQTAEDSHGAGLTLVAGDDGELLVIGSIKNAGLAEAEGEGGNGAETSQSPANEAPLDPTLIGLSRIGELLQARSRADGSCIVSPRLTLNRWVTGSQSGTQCKLRQCCQDAQGAEQPKNRVAPGKLLEKLGVSASDDSGE